MLIALFVVSMFATRYALHSTSNLLMNLAAQENIESRWKKTRFGWMDSSRWDRPNPAPTEHRIELIHPVLFSAFMILVTTGFLIWTTEERQWAEVIQTRWTGKGTKGKRKRSSPKPKIPAKN